MSKIILDIRKQSLFDFICSFFLKFFKKHKQSLSINETNHIFLSHREKILSSLKKILSLSIGLSAITSSGLNAQGHISDTVLDTTVEVDRLLSTRDRPRTNGSVVFYLSSCDANRKRQNHLF